MVDYYFFYDVNVLFMLENPRENKVQKNGMKCYGHGADNVQRCLERIVFWERSHLYNVFSLVKYHRGVEISHRGVNRLIFFNGFNMYIIL